jgi:prophage regulatory protein
MQASETRTRILRFAQVTDRIGPVHPTTLLRWERDGRFPKRIHLGLNSVGWRESDIEQWIESRSHDRSVA